MALTQTLEAGLKISNAPSDGKFLQYKDSTDKLTWAAATSVGGATGVDFNDSVKARWGTDNDLEIFHDDSNATIRETKQTLNLEGKTHTNILVNGTIKAEISASKALWHGGFYQEYLGVDGATGAKILLHEDSGAVSHKATIQASNSMSEDTQLTLPTANPTANGQVLSSTTAGVTSWTTVAGTITALNNQAANRLTTIGSTTTELDGEANLTFDGSHLEVKATGTTANLSITGGEGGSASLNLNADEADDNADKVRLITNDGGGTYFQNYKDGGWETTWHSTGGGNIELYYDNAKKLETQSGGVKVTGNLTVTGTSPGGIGEITTWSTSGFAAAADASGDITANWSEHNQTNQGNTNYSDLGFGLSQSEGNGLFSFPVTGHWLVIYQLAGYSQNTASRITGSRIYFSNNGGSSYSQVAHGQWNTYDASGVDNGVAYGQCYCSVVLDIKSDQSESNPDIVKFWYQTEGAAQISGGNSGNTVTFIKLADT